MRTQIKFSVFGIMMLYFNQCELGNIKLRSFTKDFHVLPKVEEIFLEYQFLHKGVEFLFNNNLKYHRKFEGSEKLLRFFFVKICQAWFKKYCSFHFFKNVWFLDLKYGNKICNKLISGNIKLKLICDLLLNLSFK